MQCFKLHIKNEFKNSVDKLLISRQIHEKFPNMEAVRHLRLSRKFPIRQKWGHKIKLRQTRNTFLIAILYHNSLEAFLANFWH